MEKRFKRWQKPRFSREGMKKWHWKCQHYKNLEIGRNVDIGSFTYLNAKRGIALGDYVQIGSHCSLYSISTIDGKEGAISIGKNAKVGSHSIIMPGVTIGDNSVIGAFSFVNKDIPPNAIAYGIPARVISKIPGR